MLCAAFVNANVNKFLRNIRFTDVARQRNQVHTGCTSHRRWKRKQTIIAEGTLALAGFHASPLSWSNWNSGEPGENPRNKDEKQQQTQPTYDIGSELNPGHIGGRRALSPPHHPCSP